MGPDDHLSIINLPLQSLWSQIKVFLNKQIVSSSTNNYTYKAYLETLLFNVKNIKEMRLQMQGWYKDTPGVLDATQP